MSITFDILNMVKQCQSEYDNIKKLNLSKNILSSQL